jgi:hypothetical protein
MKTLVDVVASLSLLRELVDDFVRDRLPALGLSDELHARGLTRVVRETRRLDDVNEAIGQVERAEIDARIVFDLR